MVYDANVDKKEALMVNLDAEPELSIVKSIRPGVLPPQVAVYLNPRKHMTYYFDVGATGTDRPASSRV